MSVCIAVALGLMAKFGGNVGRIAKDAGKVTTRLTHDAVGECIFLVQILMLPHSYRVVYRHGTAVLLVRVCAVAVHLHY